MANIQGRLSAVTYRHGQQPRFTFVFGRSHPDGQVHALRGIDNNWAWVTVGAPTATTVPGKPAAIAYPDGPVHRVRLFATGADGHLYRAHPDGPSWSWVDMGKPAGAGLASGPPAAVTYEDVNAGRQIHVFVRGQNGHLYANHFNGYEWTWHALGQVKGKTPVVGPPAAVAFQDGAMAPIVHAYVRCEGNTLGLFHYIGGVGTWADVQPGAPASGLLADPPGDVDQYGHLSALTYKEGAGLQRVYCFAVVDETQGPRSLYAYFGPPQSQQTPLQWSANLGTTSLVPCLGDAVTYKDGLDPQKLFVHLSNHGQSDVEFPQAHVLWWDGSSWQQAGQGSSPTAPPTAITYNDGGKRAVEVFIATKSGVMWRHQTAAGAVWSNLGSP